MKNINFFLPENFQVLVVKFSIHLNKRVFVKIRGVCSVLIGYSSLLLFVLQEYCAS